MKEKTWYILLIFESRYVSGFIATGKTEEEAIKKTKTSLINYLKNPISEERKARIKKYLKSFKRPWRTARRGVKVIRIAELTEPVETGYWIESLDEDKYLCNDSKFQGS